jgi:predicted nucleic acid-binding protein
LDADDRHHGRCVEWFQSIRSPLLVPSPVLTEVCWLLDRSKGSAVEAVFLRSLAESGGPLMLVSLVDDDLRRMADLVERYANLPLGAVDASVAAVAERLGIDTIATLDVRHFSVLRPAHVSHFSLQPTPL